MTTQTIQRIRDEADRATLHRIARGFQLTPDITSATVQVADMFGIGADETQFNLVLDEDFQVELANGDVAYITGESGGGKSTLLRELVSILERDGQRVVSIEDVELRPDLPLVDQPCFDGLDHAMKTLSRVGLSEAKLFVARYPTLSDGQKFRARLAALLASDADVWAVDEFGSILDRETAQVVAYTFQKQARRLGVTLLVATTHTDLEEALAPDVRVVKNFGPTYSVTYPDEIAPSLDIRRDNWDRIEWRVYQRDNGRGAGLGSIKAYKATDLSQFHYRSEHIAGARCIIVSHDPVEGRDIGVIVGVTADFELAARNDLTSGTYSKSTRDNKEAMRLINRDITKISRVIVIPKYRSIGLGQELVRRHLKHVKQPMVETLAEMAKFNPFFEKAGMTMAEDPGADETAKRFALKRRLAERHGADSHLLRSVKYTTEFLDDLKRREPGEAKQILLDSYQRVRNEYTRHRGSEGAPDFALDEEQWLDANTPDQARALTEIFRPRPAYLYWMRKGWSHPQAPNVGSG